jgi:uncharacterized protein (TIGR03435 family)
MSKLLAVALSGIFVVQLQAQVPSAKPAPTFEVASIKPNNSGGTNTLFGIQGDRFTATNTTLRELVRLTYQVRDLQLLGAPDWIAAEHFDIVAKATAPLKSGVVPDELKQLLSDRFGLKVHSESRELPIYALVVARTDGTSSPGLRPVETDRCPDAVARAEARARSGQPPPPPTPGQRMTCGLRFNPGSLNGGSISLAPLAQALSPVVGRVVVDRTGLTGKFDFDLSWASDPNADSIGPSIFTALQEQLGLRLESTRGSVDVLVIDQVEPLIPD